MIERLSKFLESRFGIPKEEAVLLLQRTVIALAAIVFVMLSTFLVAFDSIFVGGSLENLSEGDVAPRDFFAPSNGASYISDILTEERRNNARNAVQTRYFDPDPDVLRQQSQILQQTLDYVDDIRAAGRYDSREQQLADLSYIRTLNLSTDNARSVLQMDEDTWLAVQTEADNVLNFVYRGEQIEAGEESSYINRLGINVNSRFELLQRNVIVDLLDDLIRPNTFEDIEATNLAKEEAAAQVEPVVRSFAGGEKIVGDGEALEPLIYESLVELNLLQSDDFRIQQVIRALIASMITMVIIGLYLSRFSPYVLYHEPRQLSLIAILFLIMLAMTRFFGIYGDMYLFPSAALALLFVAIAGTHVATIMVLGLALLTGIMAGDSLELAVLIATGGIIGILGLRRAERLNQFFFAGALVGVINVAVLIIFNLASPESRELSFIIPLLVSFFNGAILVPATAIAAMYVVTVLFNLPTALKLIDLQQPNKPLLQRLLREAPGTYQHSLQVGNLAEQAANAIGADAQLTHVAALYHDIGKMQNPLYFTENQQDIGNPHDTLNDPYRSADIIIGHITEGDEMARQEGLPQRIRDFIREHHGTTQVFVFYQRALNAVDGDESAVDISDFTYPGPKPRSKETAILMLADSCEAAVRSVKPQSKQEISDLVNKLIESKRAEGQLDESGLTLNDLKMIRSIFVDILQSMFHPRINYREAIAKKSDSAPKPAPKPKAKTAETISSSNGLAAVKDESKPKAPSTKTSSSEVTRPKVTTTTQELSIADDEPMTEVPRLPSLDERKRTSSFNAILGDEKDEKNHED